MSFIQVNNLRKSYEMGASAVHALRGVSLDVDEGERVFLGGPSGSGKSTLLHIIGCLDRYDGGSVSIGGKDVAQADDREMSDFRARNIGFVFQNFNLMPVLNVLENVEYPLLLNGGKNVRQRRAQVKDMLDVVGLGAHAQHFPNELSGGQRQRVAIARALVHRPRLLIADEPTANLDSTTGDAIMDLMLGLSRSHGSTVIICTHNPELLGKAERCVMLRDGLLEHDPAALN
ncbi:MAG: ABC transporter ATP-binding protein [Candidatus Methylumidiphilus sp.]